MRSQPRRRYSVVCTLALLAGASSGCGDPTAPRLASRYRLDRIDGKALPAMITNVLQNTALAGSLHFMADGRVARLVRVRTRAGAEETHADTLAYGQRGRRVWLLDTRFLRDTTWGTVVARTIEFPAGSSLPNRFRYVSTP